LLLCLAGSGSVAGCRKGGGDKASQAPTAEAVKESLAQLRVRLDDVKKRFMALRAQVDAIPADLPGFEDVRIRFYAAEEGRGVSYGKAVWLQERLDAAVSSKNRGELDQISKDITATYDDIRRIDEIHVKLLHQVMAFERRFRMEQEAEKQAARDAAETAPAKPPRGKSKATKSN
jgi:hypothetical protein